eukprot:6293861-Prymnesium_polylepis.1
MSMGERCWETVSSTSALSPDSIGASTSASVLPPLTLRPSATPCQEPCQVWSHVMDESACVQIDRVASHRWMFSVICIGLHPCHTADERRACGLET